MFILTLVFSLSAAQAAKLEHIAPEHGVSISDGTYVIPNEFDNHLHYQQVLNRNASTGIASVTPNKKRAVVAVGSLRAFNLAAALKRDALISFDIDAKITEFNQTLAKMIATHDRVSFLRAILGMDLSGSVQVHTREYFLDALETAFVYPQSVQNPVTEFLIDPFRLDYWLQSLHEFAVSPIRWESTFFADDESYNHLRRLIREGRFLAVTGNLAGAQSLQMLAQQLDAKGYVVSELDISNALSFIVVKEPAGGIERFKRNLAVLPQDQGSQVLFTVGYGVYDGLMSMKDPKNGNWYYAVRPLRKFINIPITRESSKILRYLNQTAKPSACEETLEP